MNRISAITLQTLTLLLALVLALGLTSPASATAIRLQPTTPSVQVGSIFSVAIYADIDPADEIIGFGFDLVAPTGLVLTGFMPGAGFADDPFYLAPFSDGDGIRAASAGKLLTGPPVSGLDILLGTLLLRADGAGVYDLNLGADDLGFNFTEGLIPLSVALTNFMPAVTAARVEAVAGAAVPLPGTLACSLLALGLLGAFRRRPAAAGATRPPGCLC